MIKPKALSAGDRVAVITPGSAFDWQDLEKGVAVLQSMGLEVDLPAPLTYKHLYLAASDQDRLDQLHRAFQDKNIKGIFCARGGYGSMRLVAGLKPEIISQNPKVFVGYSDVTTLLSILTNNYSLVTFHGPLVVKDLAASANTVEWLKRAVMIAKPLGDIVPEALTGKPAVCISPGVGRGILVGGNLTLIAATLGTDFEIQTAGKILFLEDRGERPYRLDRLLHHLKLAKKFHKVAGIVFAECIDCAEPGKPPAENERQDIQAIDVIRDVLSDVEAPIIYGFPGGHGDEKVTLPLGVSVTLDADNGQVRFLESAVV